MRKQLVLVAGADFILPGLARHAQNRLSMTCMLLILPTLRLFPPRLRISLRRMGRQVSWCTTLQLMTRAGGGTFVVSGVTALKFL